MPSEADSHLMHSLNFSEEDLKANIGGEFSPAQLRRWQDERDFYSHAAERGSMRFVTVYFLLFFAGLAAAMAFTGVLEQLSESLGPAGLPALAGAFIFVVFWIIYAWRAQRESIAIVQAMGDQGQRVPGVKLYRGKVQTRMHVRGGRRSAINRVHYATINTPEGEREMLIPETGYDAFDEKSDYELYYYESTGVATFLSTRGSSSDS